MNNILDIITGKKENNEIINRKRAVEKSLSEIVKEIKTILPKDLLENIEQYTGNLETNDFSDLFKAFKRFEEDKKLDWDEEDSLILLEGILATLKTNRSITKLYMQKSKIKKILEKIIAEEMKKIENEKINMPEGGDNNGQ